MSCCGMLTAAGLLLLLLLGGAEGHLSMVCTSTSPQQPNTFAFWFITYPHPNEEEHGKAHIRAPSGEEFLGQFGDRCNPTERLLGSQPASELERVMKESCVGLSDGNGRAPLFADSVVTCYNKDGSSGEGEKALGVTGAEVVTTGYPTQKATEFFYVIPDSDSVGSGSYVTWFTETNHVMATCGEDMPCALRAVPWTFEIAVASGPLACAGAPGAGLLANTVAGKPAAGCGAGMGEGSLCNVECASGFGKVGLLECADYDNDGVAEWNPSFKCSDEPLCTLPTAANAPGLATEIKGVLPPCQALTPAGTACQYSCTGFDHQVSVGLIRCEAVSVSEGQWVADADYDGCGWTVMPTPVPVPESHWTGCFVDGWSRVLPNMVYRGAENTVGSCLVACEAEGYAYAGVEYGKECFCGDSVAGAAMTGRAECERKACSGDASEWCGGTWRLRVYQFAAPAAGSSFTPVWEGCYEDDVARRLPHLVFEDKAALTQGECNSVCQQNGYKYAGTQAGRQCFCGDDLSTSTRASPTSCNTACPGDGSQVCGGGWRNAVFRLADEPAAAAAVLEGCFVENAGFTSLPVRAYESEENDVDECTKTCRHNGHAYAGVQGKLCFCGDDLTGVVRTAGSECTGACPGDAAQTCGGPYKNSVYAVGSVPVVPVADPVREGCFADSPSRTLPSHAYDDPVGNTVEECAKTCRHNGFAYAGLQNRKQCFCGDALPAGSPLPDSRCASPCTGDASATCGGPWRNEVYKL